MDLSGLTSVTNKDQLAAWMAENLITPVSPAISASDLGTIMQKMVDILGSGSGGGGGLVMYDVKSGNYTLALTDKAIDMNLSALNMVTIPANSAVAFPVGTQILLTQSGSGQTTVGGDTGVTIHSAGGKVSLRTQYSWASLVKRDTDVWWLSGDLGDTEVPPPAPDVKINLTYGSATTISGWNNFLLGSSTTPMSLDTAAGGVSGLTIVRTSDGTDGANAATISGSFGNADFPDDVLATQWYVPGHTDTLSLTISGLTVSNQYTVKVCTAETDESNSTTIIVVGTSPNQSSHPMEPYPGAFEYDFTQVVSDGSGNLLIQFHGVTDTVKAVLNGIIISES
ncbi:hypothetical protein [Mucilaginibacter sp.]|uniref:hypothetical protein n=1 Tax=Mucilaginibacter sp. TaxID=1882438 RepID=UPI00261EF0A2|nr:hypothetical protein [Mucilaginibacter sp.]MDB4922066.1 triple helix repeat-containing collagen [Mucilaginibacter sp.]